jgi:hypothetical protein
VRWREALVLTVALWLFVLLIYLPQLVDKHAGDHWSSIALDAASIPISMLLGLGVFAVFKHTMDWSLNRRVSVLVLTVVAVSIGQRALDLLYTSWHALPKTMASSYTSVFNYICVFGVNLVLFQLTFSRRREMSRERQLADARWAAQQAQLTALRYQLNPHFLFNTLNAISSMIVTGRNAEAEQMTEKLSTFLRASLASDPTELVPLETELTLIEDYLEIESIRFGERLTVEIPSTGAAGSVLIPSFLLQPLVENAIKYGVGPSPRPVTICIAAEIAGESLILKVNDDGTFPSDHPKPVGTGVGLENVRRRLGAIYGKAASLDAGPREPGYGVTIRLPTTAPQRPERELLDNAA